jgi:hypothetical protein
MSGTPTVDAGHGRHRTRDRAPGQTGAPWLSGRAGRAVIAGSLALASATGGVVVAQTAGAAVTDVPAFPDNIVVFPDRDFVSVEGYSEHAGETATIEVTRPGQGVIGSAKALVDGSGVAFEINHPGGFCWGEGTNLKVTPDIKAGDKVTVTFPDGTGGTTTTSSAQASNAVLGADGVTVTIDVTLGTDVDPAQVEQRIVEPDLIPYIGRRDARAVPGPEAPGPRGGYSSSLQEVPGSPGKYVAKYTFDDPAAAKVAANAALGERAMSWQVEDADANRQGLTIAEFGEAGGPGMGGCPLGPNDSTPAAGSAFVALSEDKKSATVKWSPTESAPTASPVQNYTLTAVNKAADATTGRQLLIGSQYPASATSGTVDGLDPAATYDFQVRAITADGKSSTPFTVGTSAGTAPQTPGVQPQLSLSPTPGSTPGTVVQANTVTAQTDAGSTIWYTLETDPNQPNPVVSGGSVVDAALPFPSGGLTIDKKVTVHVAALNKANLIETATGTYEPVTVTAAPAAPAPKVTSSQATATVTWVPVSGETYTVTTFKSDGAPTPAFTQVGSPAPATSPFVVQNLTKGTYGFVVTATNAAGTTPSARVDVEVTGVVDTLTVARATWKAGDFRVEGTTSAPVGTVVTLKGTVGGTVVTSTTTVTAPATGGAPNDYRFRIRAGALATTRPTNVSVSTPGPSGATAPVTVG